MADRVLLTGLSGFLGLHVALTLIEAGFAVRGSIRDPGRADPVRRALAAAGADAGALEIVRLDLTDDSGWREAASGCRYLQHVASPLVLRMPADRAALIRPAVEGAARAIGAALAAGVERIVMTSSMAAIAYGHPPNRSHPFGPDDWTCLDAGPVNAYVESKTRAEREAWALMEAAGRRRNLVAVNPSVIFGPLLDDDPGASVGALARALRARIPAVPRFSWGIVDVRDVAALEVAAMTAPEAGGRRLPVSAGPMSALDVARVLTEVAPFRAKRLPRHELPDWLVRLAGRFVPDLHLAAAELGRTRAIDSSAAIALLGRPLIPPEAATAAAAQSLLARGLV